ncbi:MAG: GNAT family N-acetyltransferase [Pseudomonadota bacterium]
MADPILRPLTHADEADALALWAGLHDETPPPGAFAAVVDHPGTTVWGAELDGRVVSVAVLHLLPNVTRGGRPYRLVENVVTAPDLRGRGLGRAVMTRLEQAAWAAGAYKIMLLTGAAYGAPGFYAALGWDGTEKVAMIRRDGPPRG